MGALTSLTKWNPEDDLLLTNAVETGASLESLAKGAVNFSRRFTVRELEERWRSLLYDLNTSTEASARILEIEIGVSVNNCSKLGRTCNSKVKNTSSGKRKGESLQCHYYAIRKRARSESHKSANSGFLMPISTHAAIVNDNSLHDPFELQNKLALNKFPLSAPFSENYGHPETHFGGNRHLYPRIVELESTAPSSSLAFHGSMVASIDTELPVGISGSDCLCGHPENIFSGPIKEAGFHDAGENFDSNRTQKDLPHSLGINSRSSQTLGVSESTSTFHQLGYSSPPPSLPIWKTIEDVSTPTLQMDGQFVEKGQRILTTDCNKEMDDQSCDVVIPKGKLNDDTPTAALDNSTILLEANFIDFSSSCMSFTDDEDLLLIDVDEEDIGDRSCLNGLGSMFLSSPTDAHIDNSPLPGEPIAPDTFDIPSSNTETSQKLEAIHEEIHNVNSNLHCSVVPGVSILSSSSPGASVIENLSNCLLNTEDQDIPCNDDVIFPVKLFQAFPITNLRQDASSTLTNDEKATFGDSSLVKERKISVQPNAPNFMAGHSFLPKVSLLHSTTDCMLESVPSNMDSISKASNVSDKVMDEPNFIPPAISSHHSLDLTQTKETLNDLKIQGSSHIELASTELGCVDLFPSISISDQEEPTFENEEVDDVPNFSDVEAMILDMDLEACLFTKEEGTNGFRLKRPSSLSLSSRYQCIGTKKTIIRLEQGARSYMNRAISSHGAFAIFYGRHLKYFIRSIEVLIGRETEDIKVDIDLAKEGHANKISRRQAVIRMDENGFFHLINVGKCSIFVNSKEVQARKRISLSSRDLIEIKDMRFIFEVNEVTVRRHITSSRQINHLPKSEFDFVCS